jgi:hypothetical protein
LLFLNTLLASAVDGIIHDPSGAAIPHCAITLNGAQTISAESDAQGAFHFPNVPAGKYEISAQCPGFQPNAESVEVADAPVSLTLDMKIAEQETAVDVAGKQSSLANADPNYRAMREAMPGHSYQVKNLVLKRDVGTFTFTSGSFSFLPPVLGKVPAAVFTGEGSFHLDPATPMERNYLRLIAGSDAVDEDFRSVVLWFSDGTDNEIKKQAQATDSPPSAALHAWQEFRGRARHRTENPRSMLEYMIQSEYVANQEAEILAELYNPGEPPSFRAFIHGNKHDDLRFTVNPRGAMTYLPSPEEVSLVNLDPTGSQEGIWYLTHLASEWKAGSANSLENHHEVEAAHYRIETVIGRNDHLTSTCALTFRAITPGTRIVSLALLPSLRVADVTYQKKEVPFIQEKRKEDGSFYVIMPEPLAPGQTYEIGMQYEGNKVVRNEGSGNFYVGARASWYPNLNAFADRATYDLTFKVPKEYRLVGVGKLVKEWKEDSYSASHWVSDVPLAVAGFNYGSYKEKSIEDKTTNYQIEAYATVDPPDYLRQNNFNLTPSAMAQNAMIDAQNAIRLYEVWFGKAPYGRIAITQQPQSNFGQSWPTLVYLPIIAFLDSTQRYLLMGGASFKFADFIQEVTPHEVAHQWWGHMVGWASYHDQWLSEGFADFSAGLFLQQVENKHDQYLKFWEHARKAVLDKNSFGNRANDAGPLWMGLRLNTFKTGGAYNRIVYPKGGYVLHMLRSLMWNSKTQDQDFIAMMHDFVATYTQKNASTESFQAIVEKHMTPNLNLGGNGKMDWFFREWVYGTDVPSYRLDYSLSNEPDGKVMFKGTVTQSGVPERFAMAIPLYFDFDGHIGRAGSLALHGNETSKEFQIRLPKKPKRVMLNGEFDVLAENVEMKER